MTTFICTLFIGDILAVLFFVYLSVVYLIKHNSIFSVVPVQGSRRDTDEDDEEPVYFRSNRVVPIPCPHYINRVVLPFIKTYVTWLILVITYFSVLFIRGV